VSLAVGTETSSWRGMFLAPVRRDSGVDLSKVRMRLNPAAREISVALCRVAAAPGPTGGFCQSMEAGWRAEGTEGGGPPFTSSTAPPK
jgi:hypothetical protein